MPADEALYRMIAAISRLDDEDRMAVMRAAISLARLSRPGPLPSGQELPDPPDQAAE